MGNTDTLHPNSCFCSFSIPTSRIKVLLLVCIVFMHMRTKPHPHFKIRFLGFYKAELESKDIIIYSQYSGLVIGCRSHDQQ